MSPTKTTTRPLVHIPSTVIPQGNGTILVIPGRPRVVLEVTVRDFAKETGMSKSYVNLLCDEGKIRFRRLTQKKGSRKMIPAVELERFRNLND